MGDRLALILAMTVFGTIGIARRAIPLPSGAVALARAAIGALCLAVFMALTRRRIDLAAIRRSLVPLLLSGACLGFNWVLLFEAYKYTSVATATLCYYMAPIFFVPAAALLFGDKMTLKKTVCVLISLFGMVLVSGILEGDGIGEGEGLGILFGLAAAVLYATIVVLNKKTAAVSPFDKTLVQFLTSILVLLPYVLAAETVSTDMLTPSSVLLLLLVGVVHTGISYVLYFGAVPRLPASTVATFSYIDPVLAVLLSILLLHEPMTWQLGIGAVLILGAAFFSEKS